MKLRRSKLIVLLACVFLLAGCAKDDVGSTDGLIVPETDETEDAVLTSFALPCIEGVTWDPITCSDGTQQVLASLLYEGLFELDTAFEPQNVLCSSYTASADFLSYTFTLRSGVKFSDGSSLTAIDVSASLKRAMSSDRYGARLSNIASVSAGNGSVTVTLKSASNALASLLDVPIIKSDSAGSTVPVGTGAYMYSSDGDAKLVQNPNWWKGEALPFSSIRLSYVSDADLMPYQFSSREFHLVTTDLTGSNSLSYSGNVVTTDAPTTAMQYIGFNCKGTLFSDPAVRKALSLGIDRDYIVSAFLLGHARSTEFPVSPASDMYPSKLDMGYSAEAFAAAMENCGMNSGSRHRATMIVCDNNSFKVSAAKYIATALSLYDIDITVKELPYDEYMSALSSGNFDLYYGEVKLTADWNPSALIGTGGSLNYGGYTNSATDMLINSSLSTPEGGKSSAFLALQTRFASEAPILPIAFKTQSYVMPSGAVDEITPTAANAFYNLGSWKTHFKGEK